MPDPISPQRLRELYLPPSDAFVFVDVPAMNYLAVDGDGGPSSDAFHDAIAWLFATAFPIRQLAKERMGKNFVEPPLEALWWADDPADFVAARKEKLNWRAMLPAPDWLDSEIFASAVRRAAAKRGTPPASLRLDCFEEGRCVQILHVGPNERCVETLTRLYGEHLAKHGLVPSGPYHEIYLNDPKRTAPEKLRTVLRQPVRESTGAKARPAP